MSTLPRPTVVSAAIKNSVVISAFKTLGYASTLMIDMAIAARFGLSAETDAFFIAFTLPRLVTSILMIGASSVLIPVFTKVGIHDGIDRLWRLSSNLANIALLTMAVLGLSGVLLSPLLMMGFGIALEPSIRNMAVSMSALLFLTVMPAGATEVFTALLNSQHSFGVPEAVLLARNLLTLFLVLLLSPRYGIYAVVIGYVVAEGAQMLLLGAVLTILKGYRYRFILDFRDEHTRLVLRQLRYPTAGAALNQSYLVIERFISSFLPSGTVSALAYARRLVTALSSTFATSVSTAFLPRLSAQYMPENLGDFRRSVGLALKMALFITVPVALGAASLSVPLVELLYGRGKVDAYSVQLTAVLFGIFVAAIPFGSVVSILRSAYFSANDTKTPFVFGVFTLVTSVILGVTLTPFFGATGLALGYSLSAAATSTVLLWRLMRDIEYRAPDLALFTLKVVSAGGMMALVAYGVAHFRTPHWEPRLLTSMFASVTLGAAVYVIALLGLRTEEMAQITHAIKARLLSR